MKAIRDDGRLLVKQQAFGGHRKGIGLSYAHAQREIIRSEQNGFDPSLIDTYWGRLEILRH